MSDPRFVYLTSTQACAFLGYEGRWKLRSLYRWIAANGVPRHYRSPRRFLLRLSDLIAVLTRGGRSHASQCAAPINGAESSNVSANERTGSWTPLRTLRGVSSEHGVGAD